MLKQMVFILFFSCRSPKVVDDGDVSSFNSEDSDGDGYFTDDCDDNNASVNPGEVEVCDGVDNNCDGRIDEGVQTTYYSDLDADGFGDSEVTVESCEPPEGYVSNGTDCNDENPAILPGASEVCDGLDNNCDEQVDEGVQTTYYLDLDSDGFGDSAVTQDGCEAPENYVASDTDCNDDDTQINPDATEVCDTVDNNCDGEIDENTASDAAIWYEDLDSDGYGSSVSVTSCLQPSGHVLVGNDCDDTNAVIFPTATELCDGLINDCNLSQLDATEIDLDGDGYVSCGIDSNGWFGASISGGEDCDDTSNFYTPEDFDNDGASTCQGDCDDTNASLNILPGGGCSMGASCLDIVGTTYDVGSTYYTVDSGFGPYNVYCDMVTDGGGWTLFGNVLSGGFDYSTSTSQSPESVDLTTTFIAYKPSSTVVMMRVDGGGFSFDLIQSAPSAAFVVSIDSGYTSLYLDEVLQETNATIDTSVFGFTLQTTSSGYNGGAFFGFNGGFGSVVDGFVYDNPNGCNSPNWGMWTVQLQEANIGYVSNNNMDLSIHDGCTNASTGVQMDSLQLFYR